MDLAVDSISFDAVRVALNLVANMQRLEMTARFFIQRLELSGISEQRRQPVSKIDYQKLREIAEKTKIAGEAPVMPFDQRINALNDFMKHFSPDIALALLDERERNQQYIKSRDQENEDIALTVGRLRVELEAAKKRIAELEAEPVSQTCKLNEPSGNSPVTPDGWISCSDRMPDSNCLYLCWGTYFEGDEPGYIPAYFFVYQTNGWTEWQPVEDDCNPREVIITHWMPLPAAPKQEVK